MSNVLACYQLLELNIISAQDLSLVGRSMRTYAIAWINPDRKFSTRVDSNGGINPTWNDKFVFRIDEDFLYDDESIITIDIYALHWFRDILVGTAHVLLGDLFPQPSQPQQNTYKSTGMQFMGLQVLRPSGRPKGILNIGASIIDSSMRSMPLYTHNTTSVEYNHDDHIQPSHQAKPKLRRTKSDSSSMLGSKAVAPEHQAQVKRGKAKSQVTPSEAITKASSTLSDSDVKATPKKGKLGRKKIKVTSHHDPQNNFSARKNVHDFQVKSTPKREFQNSPNALGRTYNNNNNYKESVRATPLPTYAMRNNTLEYCNSHHSELGHQPFMTDSELGPSASEVAEMIMRQPMEDGDNSTVRGWQTKYEYCSEKSNTTTSNKKGKHSRRKTDGENGLFSCFSVICGVECSIVCGGGRGKKNRRRRVQSVDNESFI